MATLSTATPGTYTVTATYGNTIGLKVQVIGVSGLTARRIGSGESFGSSATIAAGGKGSDVHKAEIKIQLNPVPLKQATLTFPASLSGAAAHQDTDVSAVLTCGASTLTGNSSGTITLGAIDLATGTASAELKSSNVTRTCTATIGGQSVAVTMAWDIGGGINFEYEGYFIPELESEIIFYPTLDEMGTVDEDEDGTPGEGAINGHSLFYEVAAVTFDYWSYDFASGKYIDEGGVVELELLPGANQAIVFGVTINDLIVIENVNEIAPGKYSNYITVYDFYEETGTVLKCITVIKYTFDCFDREVYICE